MAQISTEAADGLVGAAEHWNAGGAYGAGQRVIRLGAVHDKHKRFLAFAE
jgi:hypothetical protein